MASLNLNFCKDTPKQKKKPSPLRFFTKANARILILIHHDVDTARNIFQEKPQNDSQQKQGHISVNTLPVPAASPQI